MHNTEPRYSEGADCPALRHKDRRDPLDMTEPGGQGQLRLLGEL